MSNFVNPGQKNEHRHFQVQENFQKNKVWSIQKTKGASRNITLSRIKISFNKTREQKLCSKMHENEIHKRK